MYRSYIESQMREMMGKIHIHLVKGRRQGANEIGWVGDVSRITARPTAAPATQPV